MIAPWCILTYVKVNVIAICFLSRGSLVSNKCFCCFLPWMSLISEKSIWKWLLSNNLQIPSPNDAEGHQFRNASLMADLAGSRIITEDELDSTTLRIAIKDIMGMLHFLGSSSFYTDLLLYRKQYKYDLKYNPTILQRLLKFLYYAILPF